MICKSRFFIKIIFLFSLIYSLQAFPKSKHHLFGIERGLMDGFSLHFAPDEFDIAISYAVLYSTLQDKDFEISSTWPYNSEFVNKENKMTQIALRFGYYFDKYGMDSFYLNLFAGHIDLTQTRTSTRLGVRSGSSVGQFIAPGLGYHWFWDNFNLRLGLALGQINYSTINFKDSSGDTVESKEPFTEDVNKMAGGLDLAIGWAF